MSDPTPSRPWWRRRLHLSLRALMVVVLVLGGSLGWVVHRARVQREAVAVITRAGGDITYDLEGSEFTFLDVIGRGFEKPQPDPPDPPAWLVKLLGVDYFGTVLMVRFAPDHGPVDDRVMASIGRLDRLISLDLDGYREVTDSSLAYLRRLLSLKLLSLSDTGVKGDGLVHLRGMRRLERLYLGRIPLGDDDLKHLAGLTALNSLDLENSHVTDAGLAHLRRLDRLTFLSLSGSRITSAGLMHLQAMTGLKHLRLERTLVESIEPLRGFDQLDWLNLGWTPIDSDGLAAVASLPRLTILNLDGTQITDAGLKHLTGLKALSDISLFATEITDAGLTHLAQFASNPRISLHGTRVTNAGVAELKARRPQLIIRSQ